MCRPNSSAGTFDVCGDSCGGLGSESPQRNCLVFTPVAAFAGTAGVFLRSTLRRRDAFVKMEGKRDIHVSRIGSVVETPAVPATPANAAANVKLAARHPGIEERRVASAGCGFARAGCIADRARVSSP
jgi:hypothetical protein